MNTGGKQQAVDGCECGKGGGSCGQRHGHRPVLDRRRFLAVSSGCVLGTLGGVTGRAAEKPATVDIGKLKDFA